MNQHSTCSKKHDDGIIIQYLIAFLHHVMSTEPQPYCRISRLMPERHHHSLYNTKCIYDCRWADSITLYALLKSSPLARRNLS